jgi:glycosyltransferase involved in cell wall biosynthesis
MFDLARELRRLGADARLYTALPRFRVESELSAATWTHPSRLLWWRLAGRVPSLRDTNRWENGTFRDFGRWFGRVAKRDRLDVVDALDGLGLEAGTRAQQSGGVWICNRGSAHILTQKQILTEEHERWGQPMPRSYFDSWMVDRCLSEYAGADAVVVPSHFAKRSFVERGHEESRVHVCPYGVDLSMFRPEERHDRKFRAIFVGAQSIQKGIGYLMDAVRPLAQSKRMELWLVGAPTSDGKPILDANSSLFVHHGVQPRHRLSWFYSQASVLVLSSVQEGLALVQAQAMACGIPVIATVNSGAEDLFTNGVEGFIVPPRDAFAIRERLEFLMENPRRLQDMGAAALDRVQQLGGWSRYGQLCRDVYQKVAAARRAAVSRAAR